MTSDEARALFSLAYDLQLSTAERRSFDEALARDAPLAEEYAGFCATFAAISGEPLDDPATPNLLPSIQRRLRNASGGR
ncbi:MAG TPA: hypothetical protein VHZ95_05745, partial [Polyangiales bacterium]|nr:hypothetical protein [Polyangiales bacterium]